MKKLILVLAAALPFLFTGCKETKALDGEWKAVSLVQDGETYTNDEAFIGFENEMGGLKVYGNSGVNLFNGTIKLKNGTVKTDGFASTRMMGPEPEMTFEDKFLEILSYADSYELNDNILVIKSSSKNGEIKFQKK